MHLTEGQITQLKGMGNMSDILQKSQKSCRDIYIYIYIVFSNLFYGPKGSIWRSSVKVGSFLCVVPICYRFFWEKLPTWLLARNLRDLLLVCANLPSPATENKRIETDSTHLPELLDFCHTASLPRN